MKYLAALLAVMFTTAASAEPPCRPTRVIHVPQVVHQVSSHIHAATVYADTHLHIVEVPVPAYVFQTLYVAPPPVTQEAQAAPLTQLEQLGSDNQLAALLGSQAGPDPAAEIRQKCASCHSYDKAKGGLALFNELGTFGPSTRNAKPLTRDNLVARARATGAEAMPPGSDAQPEKKLSEAALQYLATGN